MRIKMTGRAMAGALWLSGLLVAPVAVFAQARTPAASPMQVLVLPLSAPVVTPVAVDAAVAPAAPAAPQIVPVEPPAEVAAEPVGNSTQRLLALQRSGTLASSVPRPVPGEIAQRSRERYLKSFEHSIPEWFQPSVTSGKSSNSR